MKAVQCLFTLLHHVAVAFGPEALKGIIYLSEMSCFFHPSPLHHAVNILSQRRQQLGLCSLRVFLPLVSFPVNEIRARLKEFGRTCLHKEFLKESEGRLQGEPSVPKLHCCNISHGGGESEKSRRWLVEMSGTSFTPLLETLTSYSVL